MLMRTVKTLNYCTTMAGSLWVGDQTGTLICMTLCSRAQPSGIYKGGAQQVLPAVPVCLERGNTGRAAGSETIQHNCGLSGPKASLKAGFMSGHQGGPEQKHTGTHRLHASLRC